MKELMIRGATVKKWKLIITLISVLLVIISLMSGCSSKEETQDSYTLNNLPEGYFIKKGDNFYPLYSGGKAFSEGSISQLMGREKPAAVWGLEQEISIPVLGKDDELIYKGDTALPDAVGFIEMKDYGVTVGMVLAKTADSNVYGLTSNAEFMLCPTSSVQNALKTATSELKDIRISGLSDTKITDDILTDINTVKNLEAGKKYALHYYEGSYYREKDVYADTRIFNINKKGLYATSTYSYSRDGYVSISMPTELPSGYYYVETAGMFQYEHFEKNETSPNENQLKN